MERDFAATAPNQLWVADIAYCRMFAGWVYAAFVFDVYSPPPAGWSAGSSRSRCGPSVLALDALGMGLWASQHAGHEVSGLTHHSDKTVQYVAVRYTQRLAEAGAVATVGSTGDSYDNAPVEAFNSLFEAELFRNHGPWIGIEYLKVATAEDVDSFDHRRLYSEIGMISPVELEDNDYHNQTVPSTADAALAVL